MKKKEFTTTGRQFQTSEGLLIYGANSEIVLVSCVGTFVGTLYKGGVYAQADRRSGFTKAAIAEKLLKAHREASNVF